MMKPVMHPDEEKRGKWAVVAITSPIVSGILHVNTFVCDRIEKDGKPADWIYRLRAKDMHLTSFEGWTAQLWSGSAFDRDAVARMAKEGVSDEEVVHMFYQETFHPFMMTTWGDVPEFHKLVFARLVFEGTFPLKADDISRFGLRHGTDYFDYYLERYKLRGALEMPDESFSFPKRAEKGAMGDAERRVWIRQQLGSRLDKLE